METPYNITINEHPPQFEVHTGGDKAYLVYQYKGSDLALMHTFVPTHLRGKGIAAALAQYALEYAREKEIKVVVYCPYVTAYLERHPEYRDVVR